MLFTEFTFIFYFLPFVLAVYAGLKQRQHQMAWIFAASLFFYSAWDWRYTGLLLFSIAANFWFGQMIAAQKSRGRAKLWAAAAMAISLLPLAYFKYSAFVADTFNFDAGYKGLLPLGISFYTFQKIAYIADIYQKKLQPCRDLVRFGFFVTFFPQLIAGPIVHYKYISDQIDAKVDRNALFGEGLLYFAIGFVKKFIVADHIAHIINPFFNVAKTMPLGTEGSTMATLGYTLQLYFDFSGYSDMAMGLALMMGFTLPVNFNSPYKAHSIIEFWRRWHMTLSQFLRDYIYVPLGGNRGGEWKRHRNLMLTMLLGGLWHGAGWTFIAWGAAHGLALVVNHFINKHMQPGRTARLLGYPATFLFVALAWVLFRADSFGTAVNVYKGYFSGTPFDWKPVYWWILAGCVMLAGPNSHQIVAKLKTWTLSYGAHLREIVEKRYFIYLALAHLLWYPLVYAFYAGEIDKELYRKLPIARFARGIDIEEGDYRSNLYSNDLFAGDEKKIAFVGSSYTLSLDAFDFELGGESFKSRTIGMAGNNIQIPLRTAAEVLDTPNLHTMVIAISALNMVEISNRSWELTRQNQKAYGGAFPYECFDALNEFGYQFRTDAFAHCRGIALNTYQKLHLIAFPKAEFFQFREFVGKLATALTGGGSFNSTTLNMSAKGLREFEKETQDWRKSVLATAKRPASTNGNDEIFRWKNRGTLKAIAPGGQVYEAFRILARKANEKGVRLVIYDTPTVSPAEAPFVYPGNYHAEYLKASRKMARDLGILYHDLSGFLPWRAGSMSDFIHPVPAKAPLVQEKMLYNLFKDGTLK